MKAIRQFHPYPLNPRPTYLHWLTAGAVLLSLVGVAGLQLSSIVEPRVVMGTVVLVMGTWLLALLLRMLYHSANRSNAQRYNQLSQEVQQHWWQEHRHAVAMTEVVLIGAPCRSTQGAAALFTRLYQPAFAALPDKKSVLRTTLTQGASRATREAQLARCLALQWHEEYPGSNAVQPLRCYWLGSPAAWQAFRARVLELRPPVRLPEQPEPWLGMESLDAIIDSLQTAPARARARILCAACLSLDDVPHAGDAALLWSLAPQGGVRILRGEWFTEGSEALSDVATRALEQGELNEPAEACMSFSQPAALDVGQIGWDIAKHLQDAHFGDLGELQGMVALTLACMYAQRNRVPCAWLASDPKQTLALGVVKPDESR